MLFLFSQYFSVLPARNKFPMTVAINSIKEKMKEENISVLNFICDAKPAVTAEDVVCAHKLKQDLQLMKAPVSTCVIYVQTSLQSTEAPGVNSTSSSLVAT